MLSAENGEDEAVSEVLVATEGEERRRHGSNLIFSALNELSTDPINSQPHTPMAHLANGFAAPDWPGRYFHIDQVLDKPGPRTAPEFVPGLEACPAFPPLVNLSQRCS